MNWPWVAVAVAAECLVLARLQNLGRGIITRVLAKIPLLGWFYHSAYLPFILLKRSVPISLVARLVIEPRFGRPAGDTFFFGLITILFLDDYFTGGDDDWRKRWQEIRNKIKWKMDLPATAQEPAVRS